LNLFLYNISDMRQLQSIYQLTQSRRIGICTNIYDIFENINYNNNFIPYNGNATDLDAEEYHYWHFIPHYTNVLRRGISPLTPEDTGRGISPLTPEDTGRGISPLTPENAGRVACRSIPVDIDYIQGLMCMGIWNSKLFELAAKKYRIFLSNVVGPTLAQYVKSNSEFDILLYLYNGSEMDPEYYTWDFHKLCITALRKLEWPFNQNDQVVVPNNAIIQLNRYIRGVIGSMVYFLASDNIHNYIYWKEGILMAICYFLLHDAILKSKKAKKTIKHPRVAIQYQRFLAARMKLPIDEIKTTDKFISAITAHPCMGKEKFDNIVLYLMRYVTYTKTMPPVDWYRKIIAALYHLTTILGTRV
jgi:hypothetical protein